jgi:hypothetical protein
MPYASAKQRRYMHAKHPKIAAKWDAEIRGSRGPKGRVGKGLKRDALLGLATGTVGGIAANQLPQNQTPTGKLVRTGRKKGEVRKASSSPEIGVAGLGAAQRERRKATAQSLGYGAAATGTGLAGGTITAARWAPKALQKPLERHTPKVTRKAHQAAGMTPAPAAERAMGAFHASKPGQRFASLSRWAKKNPKTAVAAAAGLKGTALATGLASRYRGEEASGLSHEIGTTRGVKRHMRERVGKRGEAVGYLYLDPKPRSVSGDGSGGMPIRNPIRPLDALAASNLSNIPLGRGRRLLFGRTKQQDDLRRSYGQQIQTSLGVGRAQR